MTGPAVTVSGRSPLPAGRVAAIARAVLRGERRRAVLSVAFVGRDRMRRLNREFTGRRGVTDVLAFGLTGPRGSLAGDIYICPWAVRRGARRFRAPVGEELCRVLVHGVLHALGHEHPETDDRVRSPMWRRQERYVAALA